MKNLITCLSLVLLTAAATAARAALIPPITPYDYRFHLICQGDKGSGDIGGGDSSDDVGSGDDVGSDDCGGNVNT